MTFASFFKPATLAFFSILAFGCNKNHDESRANASSASSAADASAMGEIADFSSLDAKAWVNGSPVSLVESRAKHVVLIEAWHPS